MLGESGQPKQASEIVGAAGLGLLLKGLRLNLKSGLGRNMDDCIIEAVPTVMLGTAPLGLKAAAPAEMAAVLWLKAWLLLPLLAGTCCVVAG
jgi:hypothetical protein